MDLDRAFRASVFLLVLAGAVMLTLAEVNLAQGSFVYLPLAVAAIAGAWIWVEAPRRRGMPRLVANSLAVLAAAYGFADAISITGDALLGLAHWMLLVQLIKLYQHKTDRDWLQLVLLSLMHVGAAAAMTIEISFAIGLLVYVIFAAAALVSYTLRREAIRVAAAGGAAQTRGLRKLAFIRLVVSVVGFAILASGMIFLVFPRSRGEFFDISLRQRSGLTGFSDQVRLGSINSLADNESPAMTIRVSGGQLPVGELRMRGTVYDLYDGGQWTNTFKARDWSARNILLTHEIAPAEGRSGITRNIRLCAQPLLDGSVHLGRTHGVEVAKQVDLEVTLEPLGGRWLFTQGTSVLLLDEIDAFVDYRVREEKATGELRLDRQPRTKFGYRLRCELGSINPDSYSARAGAHGVLIGRDEFLQVPEELIADGRLLALARQITVEESTPQQQALAIERHLSDAYEYTTEGLASPPGRDPVLHFLFESRRGHCEYFASAMVMLLRVLGIPARMVNGFVVGEYNDLAEVYTLRQSDAHAWVEAHFDGISEVVQAGGHEVLSTGWLTFDPSPIATSSTAGGFLALLRKMAGFFKVKWDSHVLGFEQRHQVAAFRDVGEWVNRTGSRLRGTLGHLRSSGGRSALQALGAVALVAAAIALLRGSGRTRATRAERALARTRVAFYARALALLERRGIQRLPGETPRELTRRLREEQPQRYEPLEELTSLYNRLRYGDEDPGALGERLARADVALGELERRLASAATAAPGRPDAGDF